MIYVGAKTGRDGIHGASMASAEFTEESQQKRPNVQVGDPFMEKLLLEACLEAMQTGAIVGIQDMGAAGLTSSSCEMSSRAGTGIEIDMQYVPQRETGMTPYEIMLSESQERMLLVAEKGREDEVFARLPQVGSGCCHHRRRHRHRPARREGSRRSRRRYSQPRTRQRSAAVRPAAHEAATGRPRWKRPHSGARILNGDLETLLASGDLCSKRWIFEQYDWSVRTNTTLGPGSDAAIVRIKETGTSVAMSLDGNGRYCYLDPREGTKLIVAECCRNLSTVGALPVATTNNLNFGNPERPEIMAQLVESIEGMAEACEFFDVPVTGGNVSLYNETLGEAIFPSPVVGIVGLLVRQAAGACGVPQCRAGADSARRPRRVRRRPFRRHPIRQVRHPIACGAAACARYGFGEAGPGSDARRLSPRIWPNRLMILATADSAVALAECSFGPALELG